MALANMEYAKAFILEPTKLERLVDVIHELLAAPEYYDRRSLRRLHDREPR